MRVERSNRSRVGATLLAPLGLVNVEKEKLCQLGNIHICIIFLKLTMFIYMCVCVCVCVTGGLQERF
jgi:hypothetical protein